MAIKGTARRRADLGASVRSTLGPGLERPRAESLEPRGRGSTPGTEPLLRRNAGEESGSPQGSSSLFGKVFSLRLGFRVIPKENSMTGSGDVSVYHIEYYRTTELAMSSILTNRTIF